jgi:hypothetical protein
VRSGLGGDSLLRPPSSSLSKSRVVPCEPPSPPPPGSGAPCAALVVLRGPPLKSSSRAGNSPGFSREDVAGYRGSYDGGGVDVLRV